MAKVGGRNRQFVHTSSERLREMLKDPEVKRNPHRTKAIKRELRERRKGR